MGWLVPAEAVTYLDLFFQDMAALSPVDLIAYTGTDGHFELVTKEPLLCCAILMISSRYHILPGTAGISRGHFIHGHFWWHCQHLIMRLMFGQEKGSSAKTRTLGSIEGLVLMSEWNPRALHFPPETDGWGSDLLLTPNAPRPSEYTQARSIVDVTESARRSDRMSWMLLGCALSLAHELEVFNDDEETVETVASLPPKKMQAARLRSLLYVFINQLAAQQGSTSMLSQKRSAVLVNNSNSAGMPSHGAFLQAWSELVKLFKSFSDMAFPSKSATRRLLRSGRYVSIMEHFQPCLVQWAERYIDSPNIAKEMQGHLFIQHRFTQIYFSSLGMQAEYERVSTGGPRTTGALVDNEHAQQVISHSSSLLFKIVQLSERAILRFAPVRIFLHITTASIFLLKALALGVRNSQLRDVLTVLDRTVTALRASVPDDIRLAHTYTSLLQIHIARLRRAFSETLSSQQVQTRLHTPAPGSEEVIDQPAENDWMGNDDISTSSFRDWFALPFDPTMAPLFPVGLGDADASQTPLSFNGDNLAFLWNFQALG